MAKKIGNGGLQWVGGTHAVEETLRSKPQDARELWVEHEAKNQALSEIIKSARAAGIPIRYMGRHELDRAVGGGRHQGVALKTLFNEGEDFISFLRNIPNPYQSSIVLLALDQIQDPHNLGAIARSAANLGAAGLLCLKHRSSPLSPAAIQASAGAIQKIPVFKVVNLAQSLKRCKEAGFWIYGADPSGKTAWEALFNRPLVLVIGSEGYGLRSLTRSLCDELVRIPQAASGVSSLNASCAASVLLYEAVRQASFPSR